MSNKRVFYQIDGTLVPCWLFKKFKKAIEQTDICYSVSKAVLPKQIDFTIYPLPSFVNSVNISRFKQLKNKVYE